jgi:hypothetical protein
MMPGESDLRYNWVQVKLDAVDHSQLRELIIESWRMCVPKNVAAQQEEGRCTSRMRGVHRRAALVVIPSPPVSLRSAVTTAVRSAAAGHKTVPTGAIPGI